MKLTPIQRGVLVSLVLGDMGTANSEADWEKPSKEQMERGDKLANYLETLIPIEPNGKDFFDAALALGEAAMNDTLEVNDEDE